MIEFLVVRWKNLLSTGNAFTEVRLDQHQTTLIVGQNGHGKSTLLDALCLALFGRPFRKINKPNLINSINMKDCLVELEFRIGSRQYFIRRGMNPAVFEIYIDGRMVDQDSVSKDYQRYMESNILKFNYRAFTQIVILGSKSFTPFMKLGPQDRRAIIENLLDIQIFSLMNTVAKADLVTAREALEENARQTASTKDQITLQQRYVEDSKKSNQELIDKRQAEIHENEGYLTGYKTQTDELNHKASDLLQSIIDKEIVEKKLRRLDEFEVKIESKRDKAKKEKRFFTDNDNCPVCLQDIDGSFKAVKIETANTEFHQYDTALSQLESEKNKYNTRLTEIQDVLKKYQEYMSDINRIHVSESHIHSYIQKLKSEINELNNKTVLSEDMMGVSRDLIDKFQAYTDARKGLVENRAYHDIAVNLLKDSGIKAQIIKQYLPVINKMVNKYLAAMDFFVAFELDEEFCESIKSRHRDAFTYDSFSEGEKQKIDIALLFAWRAVAKMKNSMNTNLLILDEIFDSSLDGTGAELVLAILGAMPLESNVFVISHRELLHDKFQHTIKFEKRNNFSEIVTAEE